MVLLHKKNWSHNCLLIFAFHQVQGYFTQIFMCIVLEIAHYVLTSSGSLPNWGKSARGQQKVSDEADDGKIGRKEEII